MTVKTITCPDCGLLLRVARDAANSRSFYEYESIIGDAAASVSISVLGGASVAATVRGRLTLVSAAPRFGRVRGQLSPENQQYGRQKEGVRSDKQQ